MVTGGFAAGAVATGTLKGATTSALISGLTFGIAVGISNPYMQWTARSAAGGLQAELSGGKFGHGFAAAGMTQVFSPVIGRIENDYGRFVGEVMLGGTVSSITGGKFANGAGTAAFQFALGQIVNSNTSAGARGGNAKQLNRAMTAEEKSNFGDAINLALTEVGEQLRQKMWEANAEGDYADVYDFMQARNALGNADVIFRLDEYGPGGAEMTFATGINSRNTLSPRATLTIYKGAYETYLFGSPAARGYTLNLGSGQNGIVGMIVHESGHGVYWRNYSVSGRLLPQRETMADAWVDQVWPGRRF